mgnify:FL=1
MAGDILVSGLAIWAVLAFATARAASQLGYSFPEFFAYALVALPVTFVIVVLASEAKSARREADGLGATGRTPTEKIGLYALRSAVATSAVAVAAFFVAAPERLLDTVEHTVVTMEEVAHRGVEFDQCVAEDAFADCQPFENLVVLTAATNADLTPKKGVSPEKSVEPRLSNVRLEVSTLRP